MKVTYKGGPYPTIEEIAAQLKLTPAFRNSCGFLSNFSPYQSGEEMQYEGITYPSNEHFYQAQKVYGFPAQVQFERQKTIAEHPFKGLKSFVRTFGVRNNWEHMKDSIMMIGLKHKFSQQRYAWLLKRTKNEEIVERNTWGDTYWGVCNGVGENRLGQMLMEIRKTLT